MASVTNPIVINRPANLQTWDGFGACKQPDINVITVFLVIGRSAGEIVKLRIAGSVFGKVVKTQSARRDCAGKGESHRLRRQHTPVVGKLHDQRAVRGGLEPVAAMERPVVVANPRVITTERHSQMMIVVIVVK